MRGCGASQDEMRHAMRIFDGIVLREKTAKASTTDDDPGVVAGKVPPHALDVVDDLLEGVGLGPRALAVAPEVEGEHAETVAQLAVDGEVGSVITWWSGVR